MAGRDYFFLKLAGQYTKTRPPQSHLGGARRYLHVGECTLPLQVLAVAYTMHNEALRSIA